MRVCVARVVSPVSVCVVGGGVLSLSSVLTPKIAQIRRVSAFRGYSIGFPLFVGFRGIFQGVLRFAVFGVVCRTVSAVPAVGRVVSAVVACVAFLRGSVPPSLSLFSWRVVIGAKSAKFRTLSPSPCYLSGKEKPAVFGAVLAVVSGFAVVTFGRDKKERRKIFRLSSLLNYPVFFKFCR